VLNNPYRLLGIVLAAAGAVLAPVFYFIVGSIPLTATGMSAVIIGLTCVLLAKAQPYISPEACQMLLKTGMENTAALLEELGIKSKAIYLPSILRNGHPQALIPLVENGDIRDIQEKMPGRLIVRFGSHPEDMGIAVTTPGSINIDMLESKPGPTAGEIESALTYLLTGVLDIASAVAVHIADSRVDVEVSGAKMGYEDIWYYRCLGSPIASIAAAVCSEALGKPIRITEESYSKGKGRIALEVLP
jgi:hypothetical protein